MMPVDDVLERGKCAQAHATASCPFFNCIDRSTHHDAQYDDRYWKENRAKQGNAVLQDGDVVKQPGDGSCVFHSLASGLSRLGIVLTGKQLRNEVAVWMPAHVTTVLVGSTLEDWILTDLKMSVAAHANDISNDAWGGSIEMVVVAYMFKSEIRVFERSSSDGGANSFKLISRFDARFDGSAAPAARE